MAVLENVLVAVPTTVPETVYVTGCRPAGDAGVVDVARATGTKAGRGHAPGARGGKLGAGNVGGNRIGDRGAGHVAGARVADDDRVDQHLARRDIAGRRGDGARTARPAGVVALDDPGSARLSLSVAVTVL